MRDLSVGWLIIGLLVFVGVLVFVNKASKDRYGGWTFDNSPWRNDNVGYDGATPAEIRRAMRTDGDQNPSLSFASRHRYLLPTSWGDPIYPAPSAGPGSGQRRAYDMDNSGPRVGQPQNVPVKQLNMKNTNEYYTDRPYPSNPFYNSMVAPNSGLPFFSSVSAYAPLPEINMPWEKVGLLSHDHELLNLYRSPVSPYQDIWQYQVKDKNGFVIPLTKYTLLEEDQKIPHIVGKGGPWDVHLYNQNKYIWQ